MDDFRKEELIFGHLDGRLGDEEFAELQALLEGDSAARQMYVRLARLDSGLREEEMAELGEDKIIEISSVPGRVFGGSRVFAMAAAIALLAVPIWFLAFDQEAPKGSEVAVVDSTPSAPTRGVAVITAEAGAVWEEFEGEQPSEGISLEPGRFVLREGLAQIDFYGGASISLSGPAEIELVDRDAAILHRGRLRADVPPAARGFVIRSADVLVEDLGTSFGMAVGEDKNAELVVFDGEVKATGADGKPISLFGGDAVRMAQGVAMRQGMHEAGVFPDIGDVIAGAGDREESRLANWKEASLELRGDSRLIAYYDFENLTVASRRLKNRAAVGMGSELDGGIVGAKVAQGRWKGKTALDFRAEGDRVRFDIPGTFEALTILAWVRIDALDRHLNSLFLTDYFDPDEFHWQISEKGALHFATSPEGVVDIPKNNRRFYSEPFWDPSMSGQWFFLATTVDRKGAGVKHYVNGKQVGFSGGTNMEKPLGALHIGEADLGNWSDPIWETSIRTLNGRIDEFALFDAALTSEEIVNLYHQGKP
ncbi:MAG: LamG-like jellyroll fold domain-containing protein [Verrucomicrobiota bacterium]